MLPLVKEVNKVTIQNLFAALLLLTFLVLPGVSQEPLSDARESINRGNGFVARGEYEQALKEYARVGPDSGETYSIALYNAGVCYYELWRTTEAIDYYRRAVNEHKGRYAQASYALGVALEDEGRLREAKAAYEQALAAAHGDYARADFRLGLIAGNNGDVQEAIVLFRKALNRSGEHVIASHNNLGVMLARMRRLKEAEKEFATALRLSNGEFPNAAHNLELCRRLMVGVGEGDVALLRMTQAPSVDDMLRRQ